MLLSRLWPWRTPPFLAFALALSDLKTLQRQWTGCPEMEGRALWHRQHFSLDADPFPQIHRSVEPCCAALQGYHSGGCVSVLLKRVFCHSARNSLQRSLGQEFRKALTFQINILQAVPVIFIITITISTIGVFAYSCSCIFAG